MSELFAGKVALVTGAGSGIGRATAVLFARQGARVAVSDWLAGGGEETVGLIKQEGGQAVFIKTDVSKAPDVAAMVSKTMEAYGRLDCAVNNAGIEGLTAPTADCTEENWDRVISINLKGVWLCMKEEIPHMLKVGKGAIVNVSSVAGLVGFDGIPAYCASKGGVIQLTRTAALEYAKTGLRINALCPGVIWTSMVERFTRGKAEAVAQMKALEPVDRMGTPEEVAAAATWLCSDEASFITGHAMAVDGGFLAR